MRNHAVGMMGSEYVEVVDYRKAPASKKSLFPLTRTTNYRLRKSNSNRQQD